MRCIYKKNLFKKMNCSNRVATFIKSTYIYMILYIVCNVLILSCKYFHSISVINFSIYHNFFAVSKFLVLERTFWWVLCQNPSTQSCKTESSQVRPVFWETHELHFSSYMIFNNEHGTITFLQCLKLFLFVRTLLILLYY